MFSCRNTYLYVPALSDRGVHCSDISHVVCSHGHSDHIGNINLFPDALLIASYDICRGDTYYDSGLSKVSVWYIVYFCTLVQEPDPRYILK